MEKKVPERKVNLREEDIIYVYDKRINRCIKENCDGTVKYGLVLRVSVSETETLNCFECNKCHMKYTPYPNYVRLTKTDMLHIYNKDEVDARDRKREQDALKQAAREKKAQANNGERKPFEKKSFDKKPFEKKSFDKKPFEKKSYEKKPYEKKPFDPERKPFERGSYESKSYERPSYDRNSNNGRYSKDRNNNRYSSYSGYSNENRSYDRIPNTNGGYKKPFCSDKGYGRKNDNSGVFIVSGGYKKNYNNRYKKPFEKESEE